MFKLIQLLPKRPLLHMKKARKNARTFLSQAYYCEDAWRQRLNSPLLQKINLEEFYYELEQRYQKSRSLNALDIDIFANAIQNDQFCDEILDLVHKLRLTADTGNAPESMSHAVIRLLAQNQRFDDLLDALDDRLNYGLFLDYFTANLLMDIFWKAKKYAHGARVASQLMLQEELEHPLSNDLALLHCYNYLLKPEGWPVQEPPVEPEEEIKIRVKYLRNPWNDDHFDLREDKKIIGKTLAMIGKGKTDPLYQSFHILGLALYQKPYNNIPVTTPLYKEILDLLPEPHTFETESIDVNTKLIDNVKNSFTKTHQQDINQQCKIYQQWEQNRLKSMEDQKQRLHTAKRLENIKDLKQALKEKEEKLWFFENEEQIDLAIDAKTKFYPKRWFGHKKKPRHVDEGYIPPQ
ncbi:unnamed protein product [Ceutorhynchus assimilis]|uniref:Mitochondrial ribosomal protein S27 n=1 Tax=Ceutorhynchus assimilis TaxID=467358 RepID=A0A9N9MFV3_9CUCU|nr:unnamed protein product [Ceutorhynchus assimilis]